MTPLIYTISHVVKWLNFDFYGFDIVITKYFKWSENMSFCIIVFKTKYLLWKE